MRPIFRVGLVLTALLTSTFSAIAAEPAGDESLDVLRQRLSEKLSTKEPAGQVKIVTKGGNKPGKEGKPAAASAKKDPAHWSYAGEGAPEHWAELSPDNKLCAAGARQSPIDIKDSIKVELEKIRFDYQPSTFSVLDNGHTIQVNLAQGNSIQVMGRRYELVQFHFHRPAEERINGRQFDMVAHLVHKDSEGHLAVVAVLLDRDLDNKPQPLVQQVWNNLPLEKNEALTGPGTMDLRQLLPEDRSYMTYMGSLTTPPCSEGVLWMVMRQPVLLTNSQIAIFAKLYPMNARPIQASSGRLIKESQ